MSSSNKVSLGSSQGSVRRYLGEDVILGYEAPQRCKLKKKKTELQLEI